ncbi:MULTISPECIES: hypothetical protein [unclassified Arthrobacter]|uniref:hypothetical protein n=1 Tax=unclassified Arthrobacter TaxID=235627 RepID=UPI001486B14D|nr:MULTISPECIES: hypothetical protein [unclassified Arthrobacter]
MKLQVSIVVGNPKPNSRTRQVAEALLAKLLATADYDLQVIDLVDYLDEVLVLKPAR